MSLRQTITPDRLLGRVNASIRFLTISASPVAALLAGALGATIGLRATVALAAAGLLLAPLWVHFSPVRRLRAPPVPGAEPAREVPQAR